MTIVYGIPQCASVKKARLWLEQHGIDYLFHDFKKSGVSDDMLQRWIASAGLERVLNRKGTTWRKLDDAARAQADSLPGAIALMQQHSSLIKRPVVESAGSASVLLGFDALAYKEHFQP